MVLLQIFPAIHLMNFKMTLQSERRKFLIQELLRENAAGGKTFAPKGAAEEKQFLRGLMNIRPPRPIGKSFLKIQDESVSYTHLDVYKRQGIYFADSGHDASGILLCGKGVPSD